MPAQVTNYKCPACPGPLHFEGTSGKMECDYCGSVFEVAEIEALYAQQNENAAQAQAQAQAQAEAQYQSEAEAQAEAEAEAQQDPVEILTADDWDMSGMSMDWGQDAEGMRTYSCPSCGAELICDETTIATSCPYCGNPTVVPGQVSGTLKPDYVIPFKLDKEAAKDALRKHMKGKKLLPKLFSQENQLDEIKGIYVPFWLFDADAEAKINYQATRVRTWSDSSYDYTETSYYRVFREGTVGFDRIPADGSSKMPDDLMDSLEPFHFEDAVDFRSAYLTGYLADKYDVSAEDSITRANNRVDQSTRDVFASTVMGYVTVTPVSTNVHISNGKAKYALYPVWLMNTSWRGKTYTFAVNGQTGKIVGDLPMDKGAYWKWRGIFTLGFAAVIYAILWLITML